MHAVVLKYEYSITYHSHIEIMSYEILKNYAQQGFQKFLEPCSQVELLQIFLKRILVVILIFSDGI